MPRVSWRGLPCAWRWGLGIVLVWGGGARALPAAGKTMNPVGFVFGVHLHQPVGNFDYVFADHLRDVYRPLVERLAERRFFPFTLHISGPLLQWLGAPHPGP